MLEALQEFYNNNKTMFIAIVVALASIVGFMLYRRHMTSKSGVSSSGDNMVCDMDTGICRDHATMTPEQEQMMMQQHQQMMMMQQQEQQGQQQQQQGQEQFQQQQGQQQQGQQQDQGQEQMVSEL